MGGGASSGIYQQKQAASISKYGSTADYWDQRYQQDPSQFDWYQVRTVIVRVLGRDLRGW